MYRIFILYFQTLTQEQRKQCLISLHSGNNFSLLLPQYKNERTVHHAINSNRY